MEPRQVICSTCSTERPASLTDGTERPPCPKCGATGIIVAVTGTATVGVAASAGYVVGTANTPLARCGQLNAALEAVKRAVDSNTVSDAQAAVKQALEAIWSSPAFVDT